MRQLLAISLSFVFLALNAFAEGERTAAEAQRDAFAAYGAKDYEGFLEHMLETRRISPDSFSTGYNIACGYALTGRTEEALDELEALADRNIFFAIDADPDLESLRKSPRYAKLVERARASSSRVATSRILHRFDQWDVGAEGIEIDPATKRLYFGSRILDRIFLVDEQGRLWDFAVLHDGEKTNGAVGLRVDRERNLLWAAGRRLTDDPDDRGVTSIFGFDLVTGERKVLIRYPGRQSGLGFNDLIVLPDGDLLATGGTVLHIDPKTETIEEWTPGGAVQSGNGIVLSGDLRTVYVADYDRGIYAIELSSGMGWWIEPGDDAALVGIDGLYEREGSLIAVQQGISPWRVIVFELDAERRKVARSTVLERAHPDVLAATTAALDGKTFYTIGRGRIPESVPDWVSPSDRFLLGQTYILETPLP